MRRDAISAIVQNRYGGEMNRREVKKALIVKMAKATIRRMTEEKYARWVLNELAMPDTLSTRKRIVRACEELVDRYDE